MTPTVNYAAQIRELESCLPLIEAARTSVPSLVASVSPSPSSAPAHLDLATVYRLASTECELAIKSLSDRLEAIEATLVRAEHSLELDPNGIVPPARHDPSPFERIGDLLGPARGVTSDQAFHPLLDPPKSSAELDTFLATWHANHPTVRLARRRRRDGHPDNVEHVDMTLRGVLKATIVARWEEPTLAMVEIAACSSLKEDVSSSSLLSARLHESDPRRHTEPAVSTESVLALSRIDQFSHVHHRQVSHTAGREDLEPRGGPRESSSDPRSPPPRRDTDSKLTLRSEQTFLSNPPLPF